MSLKGGAIVIVGAVYALDCYHVWKYTTEYYSFTQDDYLILRKYGEELTKKHLDSNLVVDKEAYSETIKEMEHDLDASNISNDAGIYDNVLDKDLLNVARESVVFLSGGRAAVLQLMHPFIAKGIDVHSNLAFGVQQRFYNTFKYMFAMTFGNRKDAIRASNTVRRMHDKVVGNIDEHIGIYNPTSTFDASQREAILWVASTLTESMIMEYELIVARLSEEQKDNIVKSAEKNLYLFGISPATLRKQKSAMTYREFKLYNQAMWNSEICAYGPTTKRITNFLLNPPTFFHTPLLKLVRFNTAMKMPPKFQENVLQRRVTRLDMLLHVLLTALVRFVYRLLPWNFRFLSPYLKREMRLGTTSFGYLDKFVMKTSEIIANSFLKLAMPARDAKNIKLKGN